MSGGQEWGSCYGGRWERDEPGSAEFRERKRDRCLLLLIWKAGHICNTKTEQTPRGVTVRFEGQPTSVMQKRTSRTSSSCKYRPKNAYMLKQHMLLITDSFPSSLVSHFGRSCHWIVYAVTRLSLQVIMELGRYLTVLAMNDSLGCKEGVKG